MALAKRNSVEETKETEVEAAASPEVEEVEEVQEVEETQPAAESEAKPTPEKEPVEDVLEAEEEPAPKKVVATKPANTAVAKAGGEGVAQSLHSAIQALEDSGFEGLALDYRSFPVIKLSGGNFETSEEEDLGSEGFVCRIINSKSRFVVAQKGVDEDEQEVAYCTDKADILDPTTECGEKVAAWKADGIDYETPKPYIDALAVIDDENSPINGKIVSLQIPPSSISRFSGHTTTQTLIQRKKPNEYLTRVSRGKKVTGVAKPFYPWQFDLA